MIRILVTGASGFIGRHCLEALRAPHVEINATTTRSCVRHARFAQWHCCDLFNREAASRLVSDVRPTHLLHLAWIATPGVFWTSALNEDWRTASRHLAEAFVANGGKRMVVTGTCAEYGSTDGVCAEDNLNLSPSTPYATAKLALSHDLAELADRSGVSFAWARLFWTYGPYENPARFIPSIILSLLRDEPALCTTGTHRRDYLHVTDLAHAVASIVFAPIVGPINVGSGIASPIASIATTIAREMDKTDLLRLGAIVPKAEESPLVVADVKRLREEVGFRPGISLTTGLIDTIKWWTEHGSQGNSGTRNSESMLEGASIV